MTQSRTPSLLSAAAPLLALALALPSPAPAEPARTTVEDLAWISGAWAGSIGDDPVEEHWLPPAAGAMVGTFRWIKGSRVYLYELLAIEPTAAGPALKVRHFSPGLVAWEDKTGGLLFTLVEAGPRRAA